MPGWIISSSGRGGLLHDVDEKGSEVCPYGISEDESG